MLNFLNLLIKYKYIPRPEYKVKEDSFKLEEMVNSFNSIILASIFGVLMLFVPISTTVTYYENQTVIEKMPLLTNITKYEKVPYKKVVNIYENEPYTEIQMERVVDRVDNFPISWSVKWYTYNAKGEQKDYIDQDRFLNPTFDFDWKDYTLNLNHYNRVGLVAETSIWVPNSGDYFFEVGADDGVKLYLDGNVIIDRWGRYKFGKKRTTVHLKPGTHSLKLEYYEYSGDARLYFNCSPELVTGKKVTYKNVPKEVTKIRKVVVDKKYVDDFKEVSKVEQVVINREVRRVKAFEKTRIVRKPFYAVLFDNYSKKFKIIDNSTYNKSFSNLNATVSSG